MKFLNQWMDVVSTASLDGHRHDICASLVAHHDQAKNELVIYRDTFARRADSCGPEEYAYPDWLPDPNVVRTACVTDKAAGMAGQCFSEWAKHVQSQVPGTTGPTRVANTDIDDEIWFCTGSD